MRAGGARKKSIVALLTAVPFGIAAAVILGNAYHSKATGERRWHVAAPLAFAACALFALAFLLKCASQSSCLHMPTLQPVSLWHLFCWPSQSTSAVPICQRLEQNKSMSL